MKVSQPRALDCSLLVMHPICAPNVYSSDGALEFEEEGALVLPNQKLFKDAMVKALSEIIAARKDPHIAVESRLRVQPNEASEFPATHVVRLIGSGVTQANVAIYRAAAQCILSDLVPQRSLGELDSVDLLGEADVELIREVGKSVSARFANKSITQGFVVRFGLEDLNGVAVQGVMPELVLEEHVDEAIEGVGLPLAFDVQKTTVVIWMSEAANDGCKSGRIGKIEASCHDLDFLRTLARAYSNRNMVSFKALQQRGARHKKPVITLMELDEVAANEPEKFQLE